jgi:hypothetical protein
MTLQTTGTVENGIVRLEVPVDLPDKTQVQITIERWRQPKNSDKQR